MTDRPSTRTEILDAAEALFALRGFRGTSTRAIAEDVGLSQPAVNYHFESKAALFEEALERSVNGMLDSTDRVVRRLRSGEISRETAFWEICDVVFAAQTTNRLIRNVGDGDDEIGLGARMSLSTNLRRLAAAVGADDPRTRATVFMTLSSLSDLSAMTQAQRFAYGIDPKEVIAVGVEAIAGNLDGRTPG